MDLTRSKSILEANRRRIPGGVASINRLVEPIVAFERASGARMWDADGHEYIDYHAAFGPHILGHNDPDLNQAVMRVLREGGSLYGSGPTRDEGELAELFVDSVPYAEKVQFFNTGSEATAQAIRVARTWTGRDHVLFMQGGYNGHHNIVAANVMTPRSVLGQKVTADEYPIFVMTAGIPEAEQKLMHAVEFNDLEAVRTVAGRHPLAALITEPALQNVGVVKPDPGYLEGLRGLADEYGFLLIFDEVKTGFRAALGGYQQLAAVPPDLSTFGKAMANGFPIAAMAGRSPYMDLAISDDSAKRVLIAGTYNCHPVPTAAAIATLTKLRDRQLDVYGRLESLAAELEAGQRQVFAQHGVAATVNRIGSAHCVYFCDEAPRHWWNIVEDHDFEYDARYRKSLLERGIYHFPLPCKQGSISVAHTSQDIQVTLAATDEALTSL